MNILPKKRWHVRTRENIARVRKDEAEAAEKERLENVRIETADREARLNVLKQKSKQKLEEFGVDKQDSEKDNSPPPEHINFFTDLDHAVKNTNKEYEKETKEKQEEYEKKIGYLTYLGQDTNESLKKKNWYEVAPGSRFAETNNIKDTYEKLVLKDKDGKPKPKDIDVRNGEYDWKYKQRHDPINQFKKFCGKVENTKVESDKPIDVTSNKINKKKDKTNKDVKLQKLREARVKREQQEKYKTDMFLGGLNKSTVTSSDSATPSTTKIKPKYNSQFNPELARQNYR